MVHPLPPRKGPFWLPRRQINNSLRFRRGTKHLPFRRPRLHHPRLHRHQKLRNPKLRRDPSLLHPQNLRSQRWRQVLRSSPRRQGLPPPEAAPPTAPPEGQHPLEVDASSAAPHEPTAPELDDSAEQLEAELEKAKERVAWLEQRSKDQQEKELARQREELQERIAAAERQIEEQKAALVDLQPRRRELEANVKTFNEIHLKEDQEMWNIEKKLRYAAITRQEEAHRAIAVKQERTRALLDERRIWFEAIQEEQAARKERQQAAVQQQLESEGSAHLLKASDSLEAAEDTGALAKSFLDGEIPVLDEHEEVNPHAMTEMINGRRQEVHERRMAEMAAERKSIGEDRLANHQQTRSARSRT